MNATLSTNIRLALSVLGLLFSSVVLMIALVAIQAMSGSEPFREPLTFFTVSFALAVGQFVYGAAQPIFGALLDRAGTVRIIAIGALMMAVGLAATPFMASGFGLVLMLGILTAAGSGAGSFSRSSSARRRNACLPSAVRLHPALSMPADRSGNLYSHRCRRR